MTTSRFQSTVGPKLLNRMLLRGALLCVFGLGVLVVMGWQMPAERLKLWGIPLVLVALGFVLIGLVPYRQLLQLKKNPDEISLSSKQLLYSRRGQLMFTIPFAAITRTDFIEPRGVYGMALWFHPGAEGQIAAHNARLNLDQIGKLCRRRFGCDLFLPFFSREDCGAIRNQVSEA
jgi:hypothetical protein